MTDKFMNICIRVSCITRSEPKVPGTSQLNRVLKSQQYGHLYFSVTVYKASVFESTGQEYFKLIHKIYF